MTTGTVPGRDTSAAGRQVPVPGQRPFGPGAPSKPSGAAADQVPVRLSTLLAWSAALGLVMVTLALLALGHDGVFAWWLLAALLLLSVGLVAAALLLHEAFAARRSFVDALLMEAGDQHARGEVAALVRSALALARTGAAREAALVAGLAAALGADEDQPWREGT